MSTKTIAVCHNISMDRYEWYFDGDMIENKTLYELSKVGSTKARTDIAGRLNLITETMVEKYVNSSHQDA